MNHTEITCRTVQRFGPVAPHQLLLLLHGAGVDPCPGAVSKTLLRHWDNPASPSLVRVCVCGGEGGGRTLLPAASTPRCALLGKIHLLWLHVGPEDSAHCAAALKSRRGIVSHAETVTWGVMKIYCTTLRSLAKK